MWPKFFSWIKWGKVGDFIKRSWIRIVIALVVVLVAAFSVRYFMRADTKLPQKTEVVLSAPSGPQQGLIPSLEIPTQSGPVMKDVGGTEKPTKTHGPWRYRVLGLGLILGTITLAVLIWVSWGKIKKVSIGGLPDEWYKNPAIFVFFGVIVINVVFWLSARETWLFWFSNQTMFWAINLILIVAVLFLSFENWASRLIGFVLLGWTMWNIGTITGYRSDIIKHYETKEVARKEKAVKASQPTRHKVYWVKPPGVGGRNKGVTSNVPFDGGVREENGVFEWFAVYQQGSEWYTGRGTGRRASNGLIEGTWSQPFPKEEGTWRLRETAPGRFFGSYTDGSLKGAEVSLLLEPVK